jgi:hypothetical protein
VTYPRYRKGRYQATMFSRMRPMILIFPIVVLACRAPLEQRSVDEPKDGIPPALDVVSDKTFFLADAESGTVSPPWKLWGVVNQGAGMAPTTSTVRAKGGSRSWKFEVRATTADKQSSKVFQDKPQVTMGGPSGHFMSGYYNFWVYVDAGYTSKAWNMLLGWMTGVYGAPSPISHIGLENWQSNGTARGGTLQVVYVLKNCSTGAYTCPTISGYRLTGGWYKMTTASPAGIVAFPRNRWVHMSVYYKMAATYGRVTIWQDGVKIMDLSAPSMNTFGGSSYTKLTNSAGDMAIQHGIYGGPESTTRRLYVDDLKVTNYQVIP